MRTLAGWQAADGSQSTACLDTASNTPTLRCIAMAEGRLTVAVLGAAGTIAPAIVHDLAQSDEVAQMALLDLDRDKAAAVAQAHGAGKATAAAIDARDVDGLAAVLAGA